MEHSISYDWKQVVCKEQFETAIKRVQWIKPEVLCPCQGDIFNAFKLCRYKDLKVVMLGDYPYNQLNISNGLLFGIKNTSYIPPEVNIIKEAVVNFELPHNLINFDESFSKWSKQGILMLNTCLTTIKGQTNLHSKIWKPFISSTLSNISKMNNGLIFVLFGKEAEKFREYITIKDHIILTANHPREYIERRMPDKVFRQINIILTSLYNQNIEYYEEFKI